MVVKFDSFNRFEIPTFYLCNPGCTYNKGILSNTIGALSDTSDEELVLNFNTTSELNFRLNKIIREDSDENEYTLRLYKAVQNRRLIFIEDIGFFVITEVTDGYEDGLHYKDVRAESCEYEISQKSLPYIEDGTYKFRDLLEKIVASLPLWLIGDVNEDVAAKYRTFTDVSTESNALSFILENMQDAYECIIIADPINRLLNVYDQNYFVEQSPIHITKDDLIESIEIKEGSDDLYTAIYVQGDENLNISPVNPLGGNVIYNFDYYLDWMTPQLSKRVQEWKSLVNDLAPLYQKYNEDYYELLTSQYNSNADIEMLNIQLDMYRRMRNNIVAGGVDVSFDDYNKIIEENRIESDYGNVVTVNITGRIDDVKNRIADAIQDVENQIAQLSGVQNSEAELSALTIQLEVYTKMLESINSDGITAKAEEYDLIIKDTGGIPIGINNELSSTLREIDALIEQVKSKIVFAQNTIGSTGVGIETLASQIKTITDRVAVLNYFTEEEYVELSNYIFEGNYTDEYITVTKSMTYSERFEQMKTLYDRAVERLTRISEPTQEFSIDLENFLFVKDFEQWSKELMTGRLINVELDTDDIAALFLSNITVNYDDKELTLTFGNRFNRFDPKAMFNNILGDIKKSANSLNYIKEILYPVKNGEFNAMREAIESSQILTKNMALASTNQEILIDDTGILGRKMLDNGEYDPKQVKVTNQTIVFTKDGWDTANTALGNFLFNNPFTGEVEEHYGVIADTLIGSMVLAEDMAVCNTDNSIVMNKDGFTLTADYRDPSKPNKKTFEIQKIVRNNSGKEDTVRQLYIDANGNLVLNGTLSVFTSSGDMTNLEDMAASGDVDLSDVYNTIQDESSSLRDDLSGNIGDEISSLRAEVDSKYGYLTESIIGKINDAVSSGTISMKDSIELKYDILIEQIAKQLSDYKAEVGQYMTFNESGLTLGALSSAFKTVIDNRGLYFLQGDTTVSYVNNNQLYIPNAVIDNTLILGNFFFSPRDDGGFSLTWQG